MSDHVTFTIVGDVAHIAIDDGKANALSHSVIAALHAALDHAAAEAKAVVLTVPDKPDQALRIEVLDVLIPVEE